MYIGFAVGMLAGAMFVALLAGCGSHLGVMLDDTCTVSAVRTSTGVGQIAHECRPIGVTYGGRF